MFHELPSTHGAEGRKYVCEKSVRQSEVRTVSVAMSRFPWCKNTQAVEPHGHFYGVRALCHGCYVSILKLFSPHKSCTKPNKPQMGASAGGCLGIL